MIEVIKNEDQYREFSARASTLAGRDPAADTAEGRELEVLAVLLEDYERRHFPLEAPGPLDALRFRMEQLGLRPRDLVPFLGARSRVSEVLAGKRPLSLAMIRALHSRLGIPLSSLIAEQEQRVEAVEDWERFPVREMWKRGWFPDVSGKPPRRISFQETETLLSSFLAPVGGLGTLSGVLHKTDVQRTGRMADRYALAAWATFVRREAERRRLNSAFRREDWQSDLLRELRTLSRYESGPRTAVEMLESHGIIVVIEPHLPRTQLDGAALLRADNVPVIGLTLRRDRVDNFWFTLFHELMHVLLHLTSKSSQVFSSSIFLDDMEVAPDVSDLEREADDAAREALIPDRLWQASAVRFAVAPVTARDLAREAGVGEAVVAGRVRYEKKNYRLLSSMVGNGELQKLFPPNRWSDSGE
jgi:HTH-type transcriptional regulator/antitoxin HigA